MINRDQPVQLKCKPMTVLAAFLTLIIALPNFAQSEEEPIGSTQVRKLIQQLGDTSYATRESAMDELRQYPTEAIPIIVDALTHSGKEGPAKSPSAESSMRMLRLLASWANDPEKSPGPEAFVGLEKLATGTSTVSAIRAHNLLTEITLDYSRTVTQRLLASGARLGKDPVQVVTTPTYDVYLLRLDDSYRGPSKDLKCLRWLVDVEMVHARGASITSEVLKEIVQIPNLKILQLRETKLSVEDIEMISGLRELEVLEFIYTELDPASLEIIPELPVSRSMRLFGTGLDPVALEAMAEKLEGIEFVHGRGGFLGIMSQSQDSNVIGDVVEGSGAALADLRPEDRIIQINGTPITRFDELRQELSKYSATETVTVQFERPEQHVDETGRRYVVWQAMETKVKLGMQD